MLLYGQDKRLIAAIHRIRRGEKRGGIFGRAEVFAGKLAHMVWTIVSGSDISRAARIDASVKFPHLTGVVIHQDAVVEADCMIMQQVTLGQTALTGAPHVCRGAYIGAGAKVLGRITIGAGAQIGANAVVLRDVPDGATAVGVPARIILRRTDRDASGSGVTPEAVR